MIFRFIIALIVASVHRLWTEAISIKAAMATKQEVPDELANRRMEACRACPIFHKALQTCGSPLNPKSIRELGCYCFLPIKTKTLCNCWAADNGAPFGWTMDSGLNSFPERIE